MVQSGCDISHIDHGSTDLGNILHRPLPALTQFPQAGRIPSHYTIIILVRYSYYPR